MVTNVGQDRTLLLLVHSGEFIEFEDYWTGGYIFENVWQSFRTRKDRTVDLTSAPHI